MVVSLLKCVLILLGTTCLSVTTGFQPRGSSFDQSRRRRRQLILLFDHHHHQHYDIESAAKKLVWEKLKEANSRPVLNLSSRDASPEESTTINTSSTINTDGCESWSQGQLWKDTIEGLNKLGIVDVDESLYLQNCPQLLRLDPSIVLETAEFLIQEFGVEYVKREPKLLGYQPDDVKYGIEFMSTMMMQDAKPHCVISTEFYLNAIDLGIQEQAVKIALGSAGEATSKASQTIAGDAMASLKNLKEKKGLS